MPIMRAACFPSHPAATRASSVASTRIDPPPANRLVILPTDFGKLLPRRGRARAAHADAGALDVYLGTHGAVMLALRDERLSPRARIEQALRRSAAMQTDPVHPTGCMVALSSTICAEGGAPVQVLTLAERAANRAAIRACVDAAITQALQAWDANGVRP